MGIKWKQKNPSLRSIKDVIMENTGLTDEKLLNDDREYEIRGIDEGNQCFK